MSGIDENVMMYTDSGLGANETYCYQVQWVDNGTVLATSKSAPACDLRRTALKGIRNAQAIECAKRPSEQGVTSNK